MVRAAFFTKENATYKIISLSLRTGVQSPVLGQHTKKRTYVQKRNRGILEGTFVHFSSCFVFYPRCEGRGRSSTKRPSGWGTGVLVEWLRNNPSSLGLSSGVSPCWSLIGVVYPLFTEYHS